MKQILVTGSRKRAIAKVMLKEGKGRIFINGKSPEKFFKRSDIIEKILLPLKLTDTSQKFDIKVKTKGGGVSGQADAIKLGIARALQKYNPEFRKPLATAGLLTRDPREKERMKYGRAKRRKSFQWTKR